MSEVANPYTINSFYVVNAELMSYLTLPAQTDAGYESRIPPTDYH